MLTSMTASGMSRGIRLLVVVLALTASRNNFPLLSWIPAPRTAQAAVLSRATDKSSRASEQVIPSRRSLDGHQLRTLRIAMPESDLHPSVAGVPAHPAALEPAAIAVDCDIAAGANPIATDLLQLSIPQRSPFPPPL